MLEKVTIKRIQALDYGMFEFDFLIFDQESGFVFWVNPDFHFAVYRNFSKYEKNKYSFACDSDKRKELLINLENFSRIGEFVIFKDTNIHVLGKKNSNNIIMSSDFWNGKLNASLIFSTDYLPRFIEIVCKLKNLPFNEIIEI